jgi:TonB-linked SusC/RagA family outer membrane protein
MQFSFAQEKTITGIVTEGGLPLPGATVLLKGTKAGTSTDFDGNYSIQAKAGDVLEFSFVGMKTKSVTVTASNKIDVTMESDTNFDEVVVVGFNTKNRAELTSAVSNVTAEQLSRIAPSMSIDNMLQGQASGVQVTAQNGKPGQTAFIRIRGIGSIQAGNEPLYIVDGAQISENDLNGINPSDVASVSVLKDAASTSIYGARGGNGVVLITTKRGSKDRDAVISFNSRVGFTRRIKDNFTMMNSQQKLQYERELGVGVGSTVSSQAQYDGLLALDHNWEEDLLEDGFIQSNSVSISGGDTKTRYFLSLSKDEDSGIIRDIKEYSRVAGRLNVDYDAKKWLTVGTSLSFSTVELADARDRNNVQNPFRAIYDLLPYQTLFLFDGDGNQVFDDFGRPRYNPTSAGYPVKDEILYNQTQRIFNRWIGNMFAEFKLAKGLTFRSQASGVYEQFRRENFLQPGSTLDLIINGGEPTGSRTDSGSFDFTYNFLNRLNYKKTFNEKHNFDVSVLTEYIENNFKSYFARGLGGFLPGPGRPSVLDVANTPDDVGGAFLQFSIFSLAGNIDYNYDGKYIATATVRRDGSSRFGYNTQFGTFYSGSLAWNIAEEDFMKGGKVDVLKLRASAGTSGNDQIGRYASRTTFGFGPYNNETSMGPARFGDANLSWEQNFNIGVGVEFSAFNSRLRGLVDYYSRTTTDLLLGEQLSFFTGGPSVTGNLGEMLNTGFEFELAYDIIRNENLKWTVQGNFNIYDNEIKQLDGNADQLFIDSNNFTVLEIGQEVNTFFLTRYAGVNPANGEALYYDTDGNITNVADGNEVALDGKSPFARFDGSFNTNVEYKGIDLSANFYYRVGNYTYNLVEQNMLSDGDNAVNSNQRLDAFNYWRNPGDVNVLPRPFSNSNQSSDRFLQDASFLRLRSVQLGYTIPKKFLERTSIQTVRFYLAGTNLFTFAPYFKGDPEVGIGSGETQGANVIPGEFNLYSYPTVRNISFGVDVKF